MATQFSADAILAEIRLRAMLPAADATWTDANLLSVLNSEVQSWAAPLLMAERAEFLVTYMDYATVANQSAYAIPGEAIGGVLREIQAIDTGGNVWPMAQVDIQSLSPFTTVSGGTPTAFYVMGDNVLLTAPPTSGQWTLRFYYARRPSQVVLSSAAAQITGIAGNIVTCAGGFPSTFVNGTAMSFVHGASSFLNFGGSFTMPTPSGTAATFASLPTGLAVGDYLCLQNQSPFPQIPADMQPVLQQRLVATVMRAMGDDKATIEWSAFKEMEKNAKNLMAPRVQGNVKGLRGTMNKYGGGWYGIGRWG